MFSQLFHRDLGRNIEVCYIGLSLPHLMNKFNENDIKKFFTGGFNNNNWHIKHILSHKAVFRTKQEAVDYIATKIEYMARLAQSAGTRGILTEKYCESFKTDDLAENTYWILTLQGKYLDVLHSLKELNPDAFHQKILCVEDNKGYEITRGDIRNAQEQNLFRIHKYLC